MKSTQTSGHAVGTALALSLFLLSALQARAGNNESAPSGASMSKQEVKAQKKVERKARHAKKNAELSTLEKHGYTPTGNQADYPQNIQNAQQKAGGQKPGAASAP